MSIFPLHPAIVHFPIAFVVLSFFADLLSNFYRPRMLRPVGFVSLLAALISGVITVGLGFLDLNRASLTPRTESLVDLHMRIGLTLAACIALQMLWRWWIRYRGAARIGAPYLVYGFAVLSLTLFQGWYGGEMVYSHGAGVAATGQGAERAETAQRRLERVASIITGGFDTAVGASGSGNATQHGGATNQAR